MLIDDVDAGIGDFGGKTTYTVNRQNVSALLMNLADKPERLEGLVVARTPIIVTANNVNSLYEPLRRPGRMTSFYWAMSKEELGAVVVRLFAGIMTPNDCSRLGAQHQGETPAFFEQVRAEFVSMRLAGTASHADRAGFLRKLIIDPTRAGTTMRSMLEEQGKCTAEIFAIAKRIAKKSGG